LRTPRFDRRILLLALAAGFPAALAALLFIWTGDHGSSLRWTLSALILGVWIGCAVAARQSVVVPLRTLSNLLAAIRERDFSIRARGAGRRDITDDPMAAVMLEVNELAGTLHIQRLGAIEAGALLRTVMMEIDVAVFAFDASQALRLVNRAGERLLGLTAAELLDKDATGLGLAPCLAGATPRIEDVSFPGAVGRWEVRRSTFRQDGRPHQLVVLADVSRPLRDEERQAWQRLIRVIGHEINNSLAPIKSIAGSLESIVARDPSPSEWREDIRDDVTRGLGVITARAESLIRFTTAYAQLAKLPAPRLDAVRVTPLVARAIGVETRLAVTVDGGPDITIRADPDQLEQLLINLLHNAADAVSATGGSVRLGWRRDPSTISLWIDDEGVGLQNPANVFVPFFTTKPGGSGIGLVLSRQIAEAHGGSLTLENRPGARGCRALLRLPI
jgi:PAS domain S-box-containing protein